jgi:hypothetical protein
MDVENFERTLRLFQRRAPFQAFTVELVSGEKFQVDHPEALVHRAGVAIYVSPTGVPTLFDHDGVCRVIGDDLPHSSS